MMSARTQKIISIVIASLLALLLVAGLVWAHLSRTADSCRSLVVEIADADERLWVDVPEIEQWLLSASLSTRGRAVSEVNTSLIEQRVLQHPMVRTAECYLSPNGVCHVVLTQRIPVYRVQTAAESYLVDTDRKRMPLRSGMNVQWAVASGAIGERMAVNELYDLMNFLLSDRFWNERLLRVELSSPHEAIVVLNGGKRVLLGPIAGFESKLHRLRTMLEATESYAAAAEAKIYDLRFEGQVVSR